MTALNAEQAAAQLGIRGEYWDLFVLLVGRMQEPAAHEAELGRLRAELGAVNETLHRAGFDYPQGARGVRDLANSRIVLRDRLKETEEALEALRTQHAVTQRGEGAEIVGASTYSA
ncbi:hypothetical protein AB0G05_26725 [Nonomuraea wenchangensis]